MFSKVTEVYKKFLSIDWANIFFKFRYTLLLTTIGLIILGVGILSFKKKESPSKVEVLSDAVSSQTSEIVVEIAGAVVTPGVYKLPSDSRVEDLLITAGGLADNADRVWFEKVVNRAAKLSDGQKLFIPSQNENKQSNGSSANNSEGYQTISTGNEGKIGKLINVNTASLEELDTLWGIGRITAQKIVEQRPYSTIDELLSKKVLKKNVFDKIKGEITVY